MTCIFNWSWRTEESHICSQTNNEKCIFVPIYVWCYFKAQQCSIHRAEILQTFFIHLAPLRYTLEIKALLLCDGVICLLSHSYVFIKSERLEFSLLCSSSLLSERKKGKPAVLHWRTGACLGNKKPQTSSQNFFKGWCARQQKRLLWGLFKNKI